MRLGTTSFRVGATDARIISGGNNDTASFAWSDDRWYHVELRHSGGSMSVLIDGVQVLSLANPDPLEGSLRLGVSQSSNPTLIGLDEVSIGPPGHFRPRAI